MYLCLFILGGLISDADRPFVYYKLRSRPSVLSNVDIPGIALVAFVDVREEAATAGEKEDEVGANFT